MHRFSLLTAVVAVAGIDRLIKRFIESFEEGYVLFRLEHVLEIVYTVNHGAAFSVLSGKALLLTAATSAMLLFLAYFVFFYPRITIQARWCLAFLLGGGIGNWIDRVFLGGVTDYIRLLFMRFPVFNLADVFITGSVAAIIALLLFDRFELNAGG